MQLLFLKPSFSFLLGKRLKMCYNQAQNCIQIFYCHIEQKRIAVKSRVQIYDNPVDKDLLRQRWTEKLLLSGGQLT